MTTTTAHRRLAAAAAAAAIVTLTPATAFADTATFTDPAETANPDDIVRVTVNHAPKKLMVVVEQRRMRAGGNDLPIQATISLSTGRQYRGPEYEIVQDFYTEGSPNLRRTQGWDGPRGPFMDNCLAGLTWNNATDVIRFSVARRCIGRPDSVRVNVKYRFFQPVGTAKVDHAPGKREMGQRVAR